MENINFTDKTNMRLNLKILINFKEIEKELTQ